MTPPEKESDILAGIRDVLYLHKIEHFRMNSGAMFGSHKGKRWAVRFGEPGMGDLLAFPTVCGAGNMPLDAVLWIEAKRRDGKQSDDQLVFQKRVEEMGHFYLLARSTDDVLEWIERHK